MSDTGAEGDEDLRSILNGLPALVGYWDADCRNRLANDAYLEYFGLHPAEARGRHIADVLGPELYEANRPYIEAALQGEPQLFDRAIPTPSGELRHTQASYVPDVVDGEVRGFLALVTDITGRRLAELALAEAEARFRTLFRSSPIGTFIADRSMLVVEINPAGAALLGRAEEDLLGTSVSSFTHPDDVDGSRERFRRLWESASGPYRLEQRYLRADGQPVWTQLDVALLRDGAGTPTHALGQVQDITTRRLYQQQLEHLADHDPLTGLLNRRGLLRELDRCTAHAHRYGDGGALLVLDLDNFKQVNDTLGHQAGDELIADFAARLSARLRATDVIARLGGDEFAVILPHTDREQAAAVATSLVETPRSQQVRPNLGSSGRLSVSVGISMLGDAGDASEVLAQADLAMYDAKELGRDQVAWHRARPSHRPQIEGRVHWQARIRHALDHDGLGLFAEPVVQARSGAIAAYELHPRLQDDDATFNDPAFVDAVSRFDLAEEMDQWGLDRACDLLDRARRANEPFTVSTNIAGILLPGYGTLDRLERRLRASGLDPATLCIEIDEPIIASDIDAATRVAQRVKELGCQLAIDRFGSGLGSFAAFRRLPFDLLKIDGSLTARANSDRADALIVGAARDLAHGVHRQIVAQGCADEPTRSWLTGQGIDLLQGAAIGPPTPVEEAFEFLR